MPPTVAPGLDTSTPFLRAAGIAAGLSKHDLDGPAYRRMFRRVRIRADVPPTAAVLARAALLVTPEGTVASHQTAARLWGGVVPDDPDVHVTVSAARQRRRCEPLRAHLSSNAPSTARVAGIPVTTPERTFLDLAGALTLVDLVVLGDSLVRRGRSTPGALREAAEQSSVSGARRARRAAALVRARVDSPMETRLRLLLVLAGLPEPLVNVPVADPGGRTVYRIDLGYPDVRLGIEYDGRHHAESPQQWAHDIARREHLDARGWRLLVVRSADVYATPGRTLTRIVEALRLAGMTVPAAVPAGTWERHFPARG